MVNLEAIIWWLFLIDSICANIMAFLYPDFSKKKFKKFFKLFPITKAWTLFYLALVLWVGSALCRMGILPY